MSETLHPEEEITSIVFVRHGHTMQTEQGKLYTDPSALLTEKGMKQAVAIADWLPEESPSEILSSTAVRVKATAELLAARLGLPLQLIEGLDEQNVGEWEGRSYLEIKKSEPDIYTDWCKDPIRNRPPGGESIEDLVKRVRISIEEIINSCKGKRIILVSHAGVIRSAVINALGMPIDNFYRVNIPTGSASKIDYSNNFATLQYCAMRFDQK